METTAIVSLIIGVFGPILTLIGVIYTTNKQNNKRDAIVDEKINQIGEKITDLKKAQDKHNSLIERCYILEKTQAEQQRDIKTLFNTTDEIKENVRDVTATVDTIRENEIKLESRIG